MSTTKTELPTQRDLGALSWERVGGMLAALIAFMSNHSFTRAINQIAAEAEQLRLDEANAWRRRQKLARIRKACLTVVGLALVLTAYMHRVEIGIQLNKLTQSSESAAQAGLAKNLEGIRAQATKRDQILDELQQKP